MSATDRHPLRTGRTAAIAACAFGLLAAAGAGAAAADPQPMTSPVSHEVRGRMARETIDQRIAQLHHALRITADQEEAWGKVAQTMRWNEAAMRRLVATHRAEPASDRTALNDLKSYEAFNRAHLEGMKDLIASFETLYVAMPDAQKAVADKVFSRYGRAAVGSKG